MKLTHLRRYFANPRVARWRKLLGLAALAYVVLPLDAIPDAIPVLGWLDDLGVVAATLAFLSRDVAQHGADVVDAG